VARQKERKQKSPSKGSAEIKLKLARILNKPKKAILAQSTQTLSLEVSIRF
jgi:hypothetical protein